MSASAAVSLEGQHITLDELVLDDSAGLYTALRDPQVWRWVSAQQPSSIDEMRDLLQTTALLDADAGTRLPYTIRSVKSGNIVGTTSLYGYSRKNHRAKLGYTWIGKPHWGTAVNVESKLLILTFAFSELGLNRVGVMIDAANERSQAAIEKLGAIREGLLRRHAYRPDGSIRDTAVYGITDQDWPTVRTTLQSRLAAFN